jgi:mRNA interferase MazF
MTKSSARSAAPSRFDVFMVDLDPTRGTEIQKRRPCVIVTPNEMNHAMDHVIIAPMTTRKRDYPWHVTCRFGGKSGQILLDQMRCVDPQRFSRRLGRLDARTASNVLRVLAEMFAP